MKDLIFESHEPPPPPSLLQRLAQRFWLWRRRNPKHHTLVVEPKEEDEGTWGRADFDARIEHPDDCFHIEAMIWNPMMYGTCGMEDFLDTVEPNDWPEPPFSIDVHVRGEVIRGFDWVEYDAWLEPINGWPDEQAQGG